MIKYLTILMLLSLVGCEKVPMTEDGRIIHCSKHGGAKSISTYKGISGLISTDVLCNDGTIE